MYLLVLFFPLVSFLMNYSFGITLGALGVGYISVFCLLNSFLVSIFIFLEIIIRDLGCYLSLSKWIDFFPYEVFFSCSFDSLTSVMLVMILFISLSVHIYSMSYMQVDNNKNRFMALLSLFTFFMIFLVTANNFIQLLLGWEGVGIRSYLLVNFWSDRVAANRAALKALFFNRVGDFGMILALIYIFFFIKNLSFPIVFDFVFILKKAIVFQFEINFILFETKFEVTKIDIICLFFILAAIAKSAQFFLHGWLADAMEGPTPVSALIHAATMVTAGIFLSARITPLLQHAEYMLNLIMILGIITTVIFSFSGSFSNDLKKIVASSTASQLAYMFFVIGLLDVEASIFHLFLHAFFKALLFLSAGSIIHSLNDEQDIRRMGGLLAFMPFNSFCFLVGSFSLIGLPLATGGFYSKDVIIENTWLISNDYFNDLVNLGSEWGVFNTFYYNLKLAFMVFFGIFRGFVVLNFHDGPLILLFSMFLIVIGSTLAPMLWDVFISEDSFIVQNFSQVMNQSGEGNIMAFREEEMVSFLIWVIIMLGLVVLLHLSEVYMKNSDTSINNSTLKAEYLNLTMRFDFVRWGMEFFIVKLLIRFNKSVSDFLFIFLDRGFFEKIGSLFVIKVVHLFLLNISPLASGFIYRYVYVFLSVIIISFIFFNWFVFDFFFFVLQYVYFFFSSSFFIFKIFFLFFFVINFFPILIFLLNHFFFRLFNKNFIVLSLRRFFKFPLVPYKIF